MIKAEFVPPVPEERLVQLTMDEEVAITLLSLVGRVTGTGVSREHTRDIYCSLGQLGLSVRTGSFTGQVIAR
jgi:hypothetical protein